jgi:adenylate cyclase
MNTDKQEEIPRLERKLATILSADVAEFGRLMAQDEEQTLRTFRNYRKIFESIVVSHRGRVFNTAGDAILAEFQSAVEAVRCATEVQSALRTSNDQLPLDRQVRFRIGVNLGDVLLHDQDLLGDGVNVAARLQSAASPGGICISGSVYDQIRNKLSLAFKPLGHLNFKNIPQSVRTFSIMDEDANESGASQEATARAPASQPLRIVSVASLIGVLLIAASAFIYSKGARQTSSISLGGEPARTALAQTAQPGPDSKEAIGDAGDGTYSGPICYGPGPNDQARCFLGKATINHSQISSKWSGRETGTITILSGRVSAAGEVQLEIHGETPEKARIFTVDLRGAVRNGQLQASGFFRNGRTASINWHKN